MRNERNTVTEGLIDEIRSGKKESLNRLFAIYRPRISVLLHYKLPLERRYGVDIEDLVQDLFLKALDRMETFEYHGPGSFFSWLASLADKVIFDHLRHYSREKRDYRKNTRFQTVGSPAIDKAFENNPTPTQCYIRQERETRLIEALDDLPEHERDLIYMIKIEGLATSEVAKKLHKTPASIYLAIHRILKKLKPRLQACLEQ